MRRFQTLLAIATLAGLSAWAAFAAPTGVGGHLPKDFTVISEQGRPTTFADIRGEKGAVLLFIRSIDWCPFCQLQVKTWDAEKAAFAAAGYPVSVISYDTPQTQAKAKAKLGITLPLYSDTGSKMIKDLGILNSDIPADNTKLYGIPNPTIYVVDSSSTIVERFAEEGYQKRPEIADVKKALGIR